LNTTRIDDTAVDQARETLCREFAHVLSAGAFTVRTRVLMNKGEPVGVCFYGHQNNGWQIQPGRIAGVALASAIHSTLEMLASAEHHDAWSVKQDSVADHHDTDIQFHKHDWQNLSKRELESEVNGLLFRDRHDSKKDVRRSIRARRTR